jgi:hypothetical protein
MTAPRIDAADDAIAVWRLVALDATTLQAGIASPQSSGGLLRMELEAGIPYGVFDVGRTWSFDVVKGQNSISLPLAPNRPDPNALFAGTSVRRAIELGSVPLRVWSPDPALRSEAPGVEALASLLPGRAYLLEAAEDGSITLWGAVAGDYELLPVASGLTIVGPAVERLEATELSRALHWTPGNYAAQDPNDPTKTSICEIGQASGTCMPELSSSPGQVYEVVGLASETTPWL